MASYVVECSLNKVPLPSNLNPKFHKMAAFNNLDHEESTETGIGGSHDTVPFVLYILLFIVTFKSW